jgi:hypothetical protein
MLGSHHLLKEPLCRGNVALRAEHEFNRISFFVHGAIEVLTGLPDLDVCLIDTIGSAAHLQMLTYALIDFRRVSLDPTKHSRVIYVEPALTHHLFDIAIRKLIAAIPSDAQKNNGWLEAPPFEREGGVAGS